MWLVLPLAASAQPGLDNLMSTAATVTKDGSNRDWAYLLWQGTSPTLLTGKVFAVYAKAGDAAAANPYQRRAVVMLQTDPVVIQPLLNRSVNLGEDLAKLEQDIDNLFDEIMPAGTIGLANKISVVIRGAMNNPDLFANLLLLARLHPAISFCLGSAHAEQIPGPNGALTTFELRLYDMMKDLDLTVVGRVTVAAGQPAVLPAPGRPVEVPDLTPRGDLNARLRWASPDPLRRLALLQYGHNVYRMTKAFAEGAGYDVAPPSTATLLSLAAGNPSVHRLNQLPVVTDRHYTAATVADLMADPATFFFADDNRRFDPTTALPQHLFTNGARFYYFVTARDLLGRDGLVSPGTLVTICDRMPPPAPRRPRVENDYAYIGGGNSRQKLKVFWRQNVNTTNETTVNYYIYRWTSLTQMHALAGNPMNNRIAGPIPHVPGQATGSYLDDDAGSPSISTDAGRTIWYTVRAADAGACGANLGPNSAPAWGVLRDRVGPGRGGGSVEIECECPEVTYVPPLMTLMQPGLDTNSVHYRLVCSRRSKSILFADFYRMPDGPPVPQFLGRRYFNPSASQVELHYSIPKTQGPPSTVTFLASAGARSGKLAPRVSSGPVFVSTAPDTLVKVTFLAQLTRTRGPSGRDCPTHDPNPPEGGGAVNPGIKITVFFTPTTKEWKVYRRVDEGPLTLLRQGEGDFEAGEFSVEVYDDSEPANAAKICYYAQLFDEHGNAGPMERLECIETAGAAPVPAPLLNPIAALGDADAPRMGLQWFCPPHGVERFEIWIAGKPLSPGTALSPDLVNTNDNAFNFAPEDILGDPDGPPKFILYRTPRIGPSFGQGPLFNVTVTNVHPGNDYLVFVKAITKDGAVGPMSNTEPFEWATTNVLGPDVPWPDRPLPPVTETNFPLVVAKVFTTNDFVHTRRFEGCAVRIGEASFVTSTPSPNDPDFIPGTNNPVRYLYTNELTGESIFSLAMYRHQVANAEFPTVSGDLVQVTPLMEQIAYDVRPIPTIGMVATAIYDPFVRVFLDPPGNPLEPRHGLYLLDTQPVVKGARYRYVLVRFQGNHEIAELIPTNDVEVPP